MGATAVFVKLVEGGVNPRKSKSPVVVTSLSLIVARVGQDVSYPTLFAESCESIVARDNKGDADGCCEESKDHATLQ